MSDDEFEAPVGASVWERQMFEFLTSHARRESQMLDGYLSAAEASESKAFAYLVGLLMEDERRHHRQFSDLAKSLKTEAELSSAEPVVPRLDLHRGDREAILRLTHELIANEEDDAAELKRLRKELRDLEDTTLWALLVETMQLDTAKHLAVLHFIEQHAKRRHL
ncbi:MAG: hypothetical protein Q7V88_00310 [Actinomycetota bacterium]|nr:hypothetical protein [Actinomycetota bacterium]